MLEPKHNLFQKEHEDYIRIGGVPKVVVVVVVVVLAVLAETHWLPSCSSDPATWGLACLSYSEAATTSGPARAVQPHSGTGQLGCRGEA